MMSLTFKVLGRWEMGVGEGSVFGKAHPTARFFLGHGHSDLLWYNLGLNYFYFYFYFFLQLLAFL